MEDQFLDHHCNGSYAFDIGHTACRQLRDLKEIDKLTATGILLLGRELFSWSAALLPIRVSWFDR